MITKEKNYILDTIDKMEIQQNIIPIIEFPRGFIEENILNTQENILNTQGNILNTEGNILKYSQLNILIFLLIIYIIFNCIKNNNETDLLNTKKKDNKLNKEIDKFISEIEKYIKYCIENRIFFLKYLFFLFLRGFFHLLFLFILFLIYIFIIGAIFYIEFNNLIEKLKKKYGKYFKFFSFLLFLFLSLLILITKLKLIIEAENKMLRDIIY